MESKQFSLNKADLISMLKGLLITMAGAACTYLTSYLTATDFGVYTPVVMTGWALIVNLVRKYIGGEPQQN
jgi:hypothetical protein